MALDGGGKGGGGYHGVNKWRSYKKKKKQTSEDQDIGQGLAKRRLDY